MNKRILIGLILSITILFITPMMPIVQFSKATEANEQRIIEEVDALFSDTLLQEVMIYDTREYGNLNSITSLLSERLSLKDVFTESLDTDDDDPQALFFPFLGILIYGLIAFIILKIIVVIIQYFGSIIKNIANNIANRIRNIIQLIINIITFILQLILRIIQGIISVVLKTGELIITIIATILSAILTVILFIINVVVAILLRIWQGMGTFMGLMLEILILIYDTIFPSKNVIL